MLWEPRLGVIWGGFSEEELSKTRHVDGVTSHAEGERGQGCGVLSQRKEDIRTKRGSVMAPERLKTFCVSRVSFVSNKN